MKNSFMDRLKIASLSGNDQAKTSRLPRFDSLSIVSRQSVLGILFVFLTVFSGTVWGNITLTRAAMSISSTTYNTSVSTVDVDGIDFKYLKFATHTSNFNSSGLAASIFIQAKKTESYMYNDESISGLSTITVYYYSGDAFEIYSSSSKITTKPASGALTATSSGNETVSLDNNSGGKTNKTIYHKVFTVGTGHKYFYFYPGTSSAIYIYKIEISTASCSTNPTVGTASLNGAFTLSSVPLSCTASTDAGCSISAAGFVWKASSAPSSSDNPTTGSYSTAITGTIPSAGSLSLGTTYYIKAYATNSHGTTYSSTSFQLTPRSVTFHKNDGGETTSVQYVNNGVSTALTANSFSRTGYTFNGWNTDADGTSGDNYADKANITVSGGNVDLYAKWTPKTTEITLAKNNSDASGSTAGSVNYTYGENTKDSYTAATRTGYHLTGYYTATSSGTKILNADGSLAGSSITDYTDGSGNWAYDGTSLTLHAQWEIDTYTVAWQVNGEDWTPSENGGTDGSTSANYNNKVATIPTAPESSDCDGEKVFVGWTNSTYSNASTAPTTLFTTQAGSPAITGNTTFHAVFANSSGGGTADLTSSEINARYCNGSGSCGAQTQYSNSPFTIDSEDGDWTGVFAISNSTSGISINNSSYGSPTSVRAHLESPTYGANVASISITATNNAKDSKTIYICSSTEASPATNNIGSAIVPNGTDNYVIEPSSNVTSFFIYASASVIITAISVDYGSVSNYNTTCVAKHDLSSAVVPTGKATVTLGADEVAEGSTTTATYSDIAAGYEFGSWSISGTGASLSSKSTNPTTVTMGTADATVTANLNRPIYLELCSDWKAGSAKYAVYYWKGDYNGWSDFMTAADCSSGNLTTTIPGWATHVIFGRFNPSKVSTGNWDDKYNKTVDVALDATATNNYYYGVTGSSDSYSGSWKAYTSSYTVEFDKNTSANGVTDPDDQCVLGSSGRATEPTISDMSKGRLGYELVGWKDGETTWDFSTMGFTSDKTLKADWVEGATTTVALNPTWSGTGNTWDKADAIIYAHFYIDGTTQAQDVLMSKNVCDGIFTAEAPYGATHVSFARCKSGTSSLGANWDTDDNIYNYVTGQAIAANYQYSITGWGSGKVGTSQKESGSYTPTTFTISFAGNSNTGGSMDAISGIACDADQALPANAFTKTGYNFTGWKANVDVTISSATVTEGTLIEGTPTIEDIQSDITLTAQWEIIVTTVTLNKNEATSGTNQTVSATYGSAMPTTTTADQDLVAPTKNGYTLLGFWDTSETTGGTQYYDATMASVTSWDKEEASFTLYARWEINTDQFIDDMHKTEGYTSASPHEESGASYTMPGPLSNTTPGDDCITSHYIFVGWIESDAQNSNGTLKASGSGGKKIYRAGETKHATNATYYAVWAEE